VRDGHRLILVLNGLRYPGANDWFAERYRAEEAARVLGMAFREFRSYRLFKAGEIAGTVKVWGGAKKTVPVTVGKALAVTLQVDSRPNMKVTLHYTGPVEAPIAQGQQVGALSVTAPDFPGLTVPVYAVKSVPRAGIFGRMIIGLRALLKGHNAQ
jgi:D-alanyl-D-alanine carboxypeptidase (penicillin-binding protein 5/6)